MLLLESLYNFTDVLLELQKSNRLNRISSDALNTDLDSELSEINIDSENKYNLDSLIIIVYILSEAKSNFVTSHRSEIIVDILSVERNIVIVNSNIIGGPSEKQVPSRNIVINRVIIS
jgi:hypothetical protein